jgi:hypothetical protein
MLRWVGICMREVEYANLIGVGKSKWKRSLGNLGIGASVI